MGGPWASRCSSTTSRPFWAGRGSTWRTCSFSMSTGAAGSAACCWHIWLASRWSAGAAVWSGRCSTGTATRSSSTSAWERGRTPIGPCTASRARLSPVLPDNSSEMEVLRPKALETHPGEQVVPWARRQLEVAREILDNPGGGLLFATQTIGQVRAALEERDPERWEEVVAILGQAEDLAVHRDFEESRRQLAGALDKLTPK